MLQLGLSRKAVCEKTGKDKSVLSQELRRNCDKRNGSYNAGLAQRKYANRKREKPKYIHFTAAIKQKVIHALTEDLSPAQIIGRAKLKGEHWVSHETIDNFVWNDKKHGSFLYKHLRNRGKKYLPNIKQSAIF